MNIPAWERRAVGLFVRATFIRGRRAGPWPVPAGIRHEAFTLPGNTGARLAARWFPSPAPAARGVAVLAHPDRRYGQHWFLREGWVPLLGAAGLHLLTFDFPDYGASRGGSTAYFEDVLFAAEEARRRAPGLPLHLVGISLGAFSAINASPLLRGVEGMVLESPYPSFNAWYEGGSGKWGMALFDRLFPRASSYVQGDANIARADARRILVAASRDDQVTPAALSRRVAEAAPRDRTRYLELPGLAHLALFRESTQYREAVLETLGVGEEEAYRLARPPGAPGLAPSAAAGS